MRLTSIRSLPDVEINDVMKGVDDGAKARLNRDHIVSLPHYHVVIDN